MATTYNFEVLRDTPEMRLKIWGHTLEELFASALAGTADFMKPGILGLKKDQLKEWHKIRVEAVDLSSLLVEFLSKVIAEADIKGAVFSYVSLEKFGENFLEGKIFGAKIENIENTLSAVSYEEVNITKNPETGLYETTLILEM